MQRSRQAFTLAQELSHPYSLAYTQVMAARFHQLRQEEQTTQKQAEATISLSTDRGFVFLLTIGTILRGWALAGQGQAREGITQTSQGLITLNAMGAELYTRVNFLALLAEARGRTGQAEEGLSTLSEALTVMDKTGERFYEAELYRLKGELTLQQQSKVQSAKSKVPSPQPPPPNTQAEAEAETCFLKAIEVARKQQAKSLELRAVMSLSRLWQQQGKTAEARQKLAEIYNWFTEGFDTKDLQEAKMLLEELA
jgi:predicted ATPase